MKSRIKIGLHIFFLLILLLHVTNAQQNNNEQDYSDLELLDNPEGDANPTRKSIDYSDVETQYVLEKGKIILCNLYHFHGSYAWKVFKGEKQIGSYVKINNQITSIQPASPGIPTVSLVGQLPQEGQPMVPNRIELHNVRIRDEGVYTCEYDHIGQRLNQDSYRVVKVSVVMLPEIVIAPADKLEVTKGKSTHVATCTTSNARPKAEVEWTVKNVGEKPKQWREIESTFNDDVVHFSVNTELHFELENYHNGKTIECRLKEHPAWEQIEIPDDYKKGATMELDVQYKPETPVIKSVDTNKLQCNALANPEVSDNGYTWYVKEGNRSRFEIKNQASVFEITPDIHRENSTVKCRAQNRLGYSQKIENIGELFAEKEELSAGNYGFQMLLVLVIIIVVSVLSFAVYWIFRKSSGGDDLDEYDGMEEKERLNIGTPANSAFNASIVQTHNGQNGGHPNMNQTYGAKAPVFDQQNFGGEVQQVGLPNAEHVYDTSFENSVPPQEEQPQIISDLPISQYQQSSSPQPQNFTHQTTLDNMNNSFVPPGPDKDRDEAEFVDKPETRYNFTQELNTSK